MVGKLHMEAISSEKKVPTTWDAECLRSDFFLCECAFLIKIIMNRFSIPVMHFVCDREEENHCAYRILDGQWPKYKMPIL